MAKRYSCATSEIIGFKNTHNMLRALNAQRGGTAVPLQIARWHLIPVRLFDETLRGW
jgi:hypothetical protein